MGARLRDHDWEATSLGTPDTWPGSLATLVRVMLNSRQPMFVAWGPDRTLIYNESYAPMLGTREGAALGRPFFDVWPELRHEVGALMDRVFANDPVHMDDLKLTLHRNGYPEEAHFAFSYTPVPDDNGTVAGLFCACIETTREVLAERREADINRRQRLLLQQMPGFVAVLASPQHRYEYVNDAYVALSGPRELVGHTVREVFPELERQGFIGLLDRVYATGAPFTGRALPIRIGNDYADRFIDLLFQPVRDEAGDVTGIFVGGYDVTERVLAQRALEESEASLRELNRTLEERVAERTAERDRLWTLSEDMLARADLSGMMTAVSPAWTRVLGWSQTELLERPYASFMHPDDEGPTLAGLARMGETKRPTRFENRIANADGGWKPIEWTVAPEEDGVNFIAIGRDLSAVKAQEAELATVQDALRQSQKMEAVGQLTGGLAHDFNNLLAGITGSLEMMQSRIAQGRIGDIDRYMVGAQGAAKRAAALTHRLLAFSRRQTLAPKPTDVNRLVRDMEELIGRTVGPQITVESVAKAGLWTTLVDAPQLENALLNLCLNARDAMPDGGRIKIETDNEWLDERSARERDLPPGQYVTMRVSDDGTGMPADVIERAFDPFFTTKPIGVGTGLGLSMIYGFVRQSGGQVRIHSEVDKGTMVCISLPRHHAEAAVDVPAPQEAPDSGGAGETVLVIDDEPLVRMLVVDVLEDLGYTALEAGDGPQGLKVLRSDVRIDLLITDVGLPNGMNGRQVADAAREIRPELKVLFVTGYAENAVLSNGQLDQGMQVVTKPFDMAALAKRITSMIAGPT
ncbi:PAS domain-containing protein [Aurantimonas sp. E1-2-R+4]